MRKYIIRIIVVVLVYVSIALFSQLIWHPYMLLWSIEDNPNFDAETNRQIKNLVYQFYIHRYTYGFRDESIFDSIFAEGFKEPPVRTFRNFLPQGILYSRNQSYMQGLRYLGDGRLILYLSLRDTMGLFRLDNRFYEFIFVRHPDGMYKIRSVGLDR